MKKFLLFKTLFYDQFLIPSFSIAVNINTDFDLNYPGSVTNTIKLKASETRQALQYCEKIKSSKNRLTLTQAGSDIDEFFDDHLV